jgi:phosphoribosylformylglycinamidine synthase
MGAVRRFAASGGLVIGICNGFQILCESGLLPGVLLRNRGLRFICRHVHLRLENSATPFTRAGREGDVLRIPIAHGEGNYFADEAKLRELEEAGRVNLRYCGPGREVEDRHNPNGAANNIAGIVNREGNVAGMMPHPERACEPLLGSEDGLVILNSILGGSA